MNNPNTTQNDVLNYLRTIPSGITFVHGKAGCGKTTLIKKLVSEISGCQILTPTNLAASLYHGARTMHSFFYGAFDDLDEGYQNPQNLTPTKIATFINRCKDNMAKKIFNKWRFFLMTRLCAWFGGRCFHGGGRGMGIFFLLCVLNDVY